MRAHFLPSARATNWLLTAGFFALGYALYLRYLVIENSQVGIACEAGRASLLCQVRIATIRVFTPQIFGLTALAAALINLLLRPSVIVLGIGLVAAAFGIVLYNTTLSGLAVGLLIMSFARPARAQG